MTRHEHKTEQQEGAAGSSDHAAFHDITECKRVEEELRKSREFSDRLLESSLNGLYIFDLESQTITFINAQYTRLTGYTLEDINRIRDEGSFFQLFHPDDLARMLDHSQRMANIRDGETREIEYRYRVKDGDWRWMLSRETAFSRNPDGTLRQYIGSFLDITERKRVEEELLESEARNRALSEAAFEGIGITRDSVILEVNQALLSMTGYERSDLIGVSAAIMVTPESQETALQHILSGSEEPYEMEVRRKDGSTFIAEVRGKVTIYKGEPARVGALIDITERKRAEQALRENEEKYRLLFENMSEGFALCEMVWDEKGAPIDFRYLELNKAWEKQTGLSVKDTVGCTVHEIIPGIETYWIETYARVVQTGEPIKYENYVSGLAKWIEVYAFKHSENRFAALFLDVTERKLAQEALEAERARLRTVLATLPVGVFIADATGRIVESNEAAKRIWGGITPLSEGMFGYEQYKGWWTDTGEPVKAEDWPGSRALLTGETVLGAVIDIERFDCTWGTILNSAVPMHDDQGRIVGAVFVIQDITELERLRKELERALGKARHDRERLEAMESIAEAGISTTELGEALDTVAEKVAHGLHTHSCTIFLCSDETDDLVARAAYGIPEECGFQVRSDEGFVGKILSTRRTIYVRDAEHDALITDPHVKRAKTKSLLGTPLIARGHEVGVVYLDTQEEREFSSEERRLLETMAARTALIIENARLYEQLVQSRDEVQQNFTLLQRTLLPPAELQVGPGYNMSAAYLSPFGLEIGGDFYDVFNTEDGKHAILIGDVAGKGISAVSLATATRSTIRSLVYDIPSVGEALTHANAVLCSQDFLESESVFVTAFVAVIDPATGKLCYAGAGHPPPAIYRSADGTIDFLEAGSPPLRVGPCINFKESSSYLLPGDKIVLYTDGLSEARRGIELFGAEGIQNILQEYGRLASEELVALFIESASTWTGGNLTDDTAIMVIEKEA